jgi:hypothetical protein
MKKQNIISEEELNSRNIEISRLKGITIFRENDIYEFGKAVLNVMHGHDEYRIKNGGYLGYTSPTVYGLARMFASTANLYLPEDFVHDILKKHGFTGRESLQEEKTG